MDTRLTRSSSFAAFVVLSAALLQYAANLNRVHAAIQGQQIPNTHNAVRELSFKEFFDAASGELKPSAMLLQLNGKRVRLIGFMAQMETPPSGAFYLCPRPIICDEEGAGTADLPPETVVVIVRSMRDKAVPFSPRELEVTGILEVGNRQETDGRVSFIRLVLDGPEVAPSTRSSTRDLNK